MDCSNVENENGENNNNSESDSWFSIQTTSIRQETKVVHHLPVGRDDLHYNMNHLKRGRCIVLNYKHFSSQELRAREGTEKDGFSLKKTFENLNFDIETHENLTLNETFDVLQKESNRNHESYDCFVLCILTHGSNGILHCKDRQLKTEQIFNLFTANRCLSLVGKPKLFFIQACQGEMFDSGTLVHDSPVASPGYFLIPNYADFLIFYSTYPGHFSWRNSSKGSWFIQELCEVLEQYNEKYDLMTMLTIVCRKVAFEYQSNVPNNLEMDRKKQIPCILSTLTRLVQF